ncbi:hypothetical protein A2U01_0000867 [Trifolium medium]|uniref:Uncharacterized protein n=1 Tax=Trifolium medium TaxID=97028 RepID=A0A392LYU8_9FABA|nr:hypothetical protein [Trifolium medium]
MANPQRIIRCIGNTSAYSENDSEHQKPENASVRKREAMKHLFLVTAANLPYLGVFIAAKDKPIFSNPKNPSAAYVFYTLMMIIHILFLSMVYFTMLDHSCFITETQSTLEMVVFTLCFVSASVLMIGIVQIHCGFIAGILGLLAIYTAFTPREHLTWAILVIVLFGSGVSVYYGPIMIKSFLNLP